MQLALNTYQPFLPPPPPSCLPRRLTSCRGKNSQATFSRKDVCLCYCFVPGRAQTGTLGLAGTPQLGLPKCTKRQFPRGLHLGAFVLCTKWSLSLHRHHHQEVPASIAHSPGPLPAWHQRQLPLLLSQKTLLSTGPGSNNADQSPSDTCSV